MASRIEIDIETYVLDKINKNLQIRNKELDENKKLDLNQYVGLLLERECARREYDELENKLYALAGRLQGLENSIEGKRAKSLFNIDELTQIKQSGK